MLFHQCQFVLGGIIVRAYVYMCRTDVLGWTGRISQVVFLEDPLCTDMAKCPCADNYEPVDTCGRGLSHEHSLWLEQCGILVADLGMESRDPLPSLRSTFTWLSAVR
jgi:hypothetical protein